MPASEYTAPAGVTFQQTEGSSADSSFGSHANPNFVKAQGSDRVVEDCQNSAVVSLNARANTTSDHQMQRTMGGLCSFMGARVMAHTSLECTCFEKGRAEASCRKSSRCRGSSLFVPSSRLCGTFRAASPACSTQIVAMCNVLIRLVNVNTSLVLIRNTPVEIEQQEQGGAGTCRWMLSSEVDVSECRRYRSCWNKACRSVHRPGSNSSCSKLQSGLLATD
jgi:hypothetical protein